MLQERAHHTNHSEESGSVRISRVKTYKTTAGPLFLRSGCSRSFVEGLKADEGLRAFARLPEREHQLLSLALEFETVEESLIVGLGLSWHWDDEGLGMSRFDYREMVARLFAAHGFAEYLTSEPNIRLDPANILVARLGRRIDGENMNRFFQQLLRSETLPGL
jgi:hypothetical protein